MSSEYETYPLVMDTLPEEFLQVAQQELNETLEKRTESLKELTTRAKSDKILKDLELYPYFLLPFLRVSKFDVDKAFGRLQKYINFRRKHPDFFTGIQDHMYSSSPSFRWSSPLPWRSPEGCAIIVDKFGQWDPREISFENVLRTAHIVLQQILRYPATQITGIIVILDFKKTSLQHLRYGTPGILYQVAQMFLECSPARFKQFHCVNCTLPMKIAWTIITPFMSEKLRKRVIFHAQPEDLLDFFPKHTLPVEYGGDIEDFYMHSWVKEANNRMGIWNINGL